MNDIVNGLYQDDLTGAAVSIKLEHHKIHESQSYYLKSFVDLPINQVVDARMRTPDGSTKIHFLPVAETESEYTFNIYEDVTLVTTGTLLTPRNRDRGYNSNSPDQSQLIPDLIVTANTTAANSATNISGAIDIYPGITGSGKQAGGNNRTSDEIILRSDTVYCLRLSCTAAGWSDFLINWYEQVSKKGD